MACTVNGIFEYVLYGIQLLWPPTTNRRGKSWCRGSTSTTLCKLGFVVNSQVSVSAYLCAHQQGQLLKPCWSSSSAKSPVHHRPRTEFSQGHPLVQQQSLVRQHHCKLSTTERGNTHKHLIVATNSEDEGHKVFSACCLRFSGYNSCGGSTVLKVCLILDSVQGPLN